MSHKLGICIPYRNREEHLRELVPHLTKHLNDQGIKHKFYVGHQVDDKLLNRGAMKNIAAIYALKDGCDYVAWHDVDMLPFLDCDYTYPESTPIHIATKLSKYNYGLGYDQYFGGVVLFNKEQIERTNGYSNDYWDWGQEDDDLFWRCYYEGYTTGKIMREYYDRTVAYFNGDSSYISLPVKREVSGCLHEDHTISILFKAQQQPNKVPIWLVGDKNKKFIEYPLLRKDKSYTWGLSFNNSRAVTMLLHDKQGHVYYNWGKRFENLWTWATLSYSSDNKEVYFYINDDLCCQMNGIKQSVPFPIFDDLKIQPAVGNFLLGHCSHMNTYYKGQIAEIKIHDKYFTDVNEAITSKDNLVLHYDFNYGLRDLVSEDVAEAHDVEFLSQNVEVIENILPYRREGTMKCLNHINEGFVNGTWAKGETTARNEKRFVTEMQQGKIDYKKDGMNNLKYDVVSEEMFMDNCLMINVKL